MLVDPELIERIYEAAAMPEQWPAVLQSVADAVDAFGACFVHRTVGSGSWTLSSGMAEFGESYLAAGWIARDDRVPLVVAERYPGFRVDSDLWSEADQRAMPIYRDFLLPRGLNASGATFVQGSREDAVHIGVEGLASYTSAGAAVPVLDAFRPHLARAISLSVQLGQVRDDGVVGGLEAAGVAAAVVSVDGRLRASNAAFARRLGSIFHTRAGRIRFADPFLQARLAEAIAAFDGTNALSLAVGTGDEAPPFAIHLVPLRRGARDVVGWDGILMLVADAANASVPGADLLRLLFDLTPAEARVARMLAEGRSPTAAATALNITEATARTHLRRIFAKTGVGRQAELVRLLLGTGAPN